MRGEPSNPRASVRAVWTGRSAVWAPPPPARGSLWPPGRWVKHPTLTPWLAVHSELEPASTAGEKRFRKQLIPAKYWYDLVIDKLSVLLQTWGSGRGAGERIHPEGDRQPGGRKWLCQHPWNGWIHHLVLHTTWQVTLFCSVCFVFLWWSCWLSLSDVIRMWCDLDNRIRTKWSLATLMPWHYVGVLFIKLLKPLPALMAALPSNELKSKTF